MRKIAGLLAAIAMLSTLCSLMPARAAGTIPLALSQQQDINGRPLNGCLLYIYQVGTVATLQNAFQDFGLATVMPNPMQCDTTGRLPMFYLADGQVHIRLTDSGGLQVFDYPTMQVIGPSSGGGGGGGGVDATSVASTGDTKWRQSSEVLAGWVKLNTTTIGAATSGATQRANADTQALYVWLWTNCPDSKCAVATGRGANALADFSANKSIATPDMRGRAPFGLNDMGAADSGTISALAFGGGDTGTTVGAPGGVSQFAVSSAQMPVHFHNIAVQTTSTENGTHTHNDNGTTGVEDANHLHNVNGTTASNGDHAHTVGENAVGVGGVAVASGSTSAGVGFTENTSTTGAHTHTVNVNSGNVSATHHHSYSAVTNTQNSTHTHNFSGTTSNTGSGSLIGLMNPLRLGTWYLKL